MGTSHSKHSHYQQQKHRIHGLSKIGSRRAHSATNSFRTNKMTNPTLKNSTTASNHLKETSPKTTPNLQYYETAAQPQNKYEKYRSKKSIDTDKLVRSQSLNNLPLTSKQSLQYNLQHNTNYYTPTKKQTSPMQPQQKSNAHKINSISLIQELELPQQTIIKVKQPINSNVISSSSYDSNVMRSKKEQKSKNVAYKIYRIQDNSKNKQQTSQQPYQYKKESDNQLEQIPSIHSRTEESNNRTNTLPSRYQPYYTNSKFKIKQSSIPSIQPSQNSWRKPIYSGPYGNQHGSIY